MIPHFNLTTFTCKQALRPHGVTRELGGRLCHKGIALFDQFCAQVITSCLNPLISNIHIQILETDLYTFP